MKSFAKLLAVAVALVASTVVAHADPITGTITVQGSDTYNPTSITFVPGSLSIQNDTLSGTLEALTGNQNVGQYIYPTLETSGLTYNTTPNSELFTITNDGVTVTLTVNTVTGGEVADGDLNLSGTATLTETGYDPTTGIFTLTSDGGAQNEDNGPTVGFSVTPNLTPTPEPSSLLLLGTGLLGSAGALYRRSRMNSAV